MKCLHYGEDECSLMVVGCQNYCGDIYHGLRLICWSHFLVMLAWQLSFPVVCLVCSVGVEGCSDELCPGGKRLILCAPPSGQAPGEAYVERLPFNLHHKFNSTTIQGRANVSCPCIFHRLAWYQFERENFELELCIEDG